MVPHPRKPEPEAGHDLRQKPPAGTQGVPRKKENIARLIEGIRGKLEAGREAAGHHLGERRPLGHVEELLRELDEFCPEHTGHRQRRHRHDRMHRA